MRSTGWCSIFSGIEGCKTLSLRRRIAVQANDGGHGRRFLFSGFLRSVAVDQLNPFNAGKQKPFESPDISLY